MHFFSLTMDKEMKFRHKVTQVISEVLYRKSLHPMAVTNTTGNSNQ